jgi:hypothetical protein
VPSSAALSLGGQKLLSTTPLNNTACLKPKLGTASVQFTGEIGSLGLELSNATASIYWNFAVLFCKAHNPKVVSSNLTPATMGAREENPLSALLICGYELSRNNSLA